MLAHIFFTNFEPCSRRTGRCGTTMVLSTNPCTAASFERAGYKRPVRVRTTDLIVPCKPQQGRRGHYYFLLHGNVLVVG